MNKIQNCAKVQRTPEPSRIPAKIIKIHWLDDENRHPPTVERDFPPDPFPADPAARQPVPGHPAGRSTAHLRRPAPRRSPQPCRSARPPGAWNGAPVQLGRRIARQRWGNMSQSCGQLVNRTGQWLKSQGLCFFPHPTP